MLLQYPHCSEISSNRYPAIYDPEFGQGYWIGNGSKWGMVAHLDLGT